MSIQSEIDRINANVANTYATLETKGATMPTEQNSDNLQATAASISVPSSSDIEKWNYDTTYINSHPENNPTIIPFIYNDLASLTKRGGSLKAYITTATDFTPLTIAESAMSLSSPENLFDGSPSYAMISTTGDFTAVFDLTLHKTFSYANQFYIDFGAVGWRAKNIAVYVMNTATETAYVKKAEITGNTRGQWFNNISHSSTNAEGTTVQGFNRLRVVLSGFNNTASTSGKRIAQIGLINYGSYGVTETFISRGGCNGIFGSLIPNSNNAIDLGTSSKVWRNIYAQNLFKGGNPVATEESAEKFGGYGLRVVTDASDTGAANYITFKI